MDRMESHAQSVAGENPEIAEAIERVRTVRGPNEEHTRVFRLEAIADLWEKLGDVTADAKADEPGEPLEAKRVAELRQIADEAGIENVSQTRKPQLIEAIRESESENEEG